MPLYSPHRFFGCAVTDTCVAGSARMALGTALAGEDVGGALAGVAGVGALVQAPSNASSSSTAATEDPARPDMVAPLHVNLFEQSPISRRSQVADRKQ